MTALSAWVTADPEEIDAATVRIVQCSGSPGFIACWEVGGLGHQTHFADPVDVAAAYRRLADRIDVAVTEFHARLDAARLAEASA